MTRAGEPALRPRPRCPALPPGWLARDRLHAQLTAGIDYPVTTVTGPPGAGKTVLLSGWAQHGAPPVAWLSVEPSDNEPAGDGRPRFWPRLVETIRAVDARLAEAVGAIGDRRAEPDGAVGAGLAEAAGAVDAGLAAGLSAAMAPVVLIVDDGQRLGPPAIRALGALVAGLPPRLRLIVAGRHLSRLPVEEWRGESPWREIGAADLRFTPDEAVTFFTSRRSSPLPRDTVRALADRSEGWAAGLRFADLMIPLWSSPTTRLEAFTGEARLAVEYFNHELIESRPASQVRFLLASATLDLLTAEGCEAVTGRSDAAALLETLCREHVLLDRSDPAVPSYRYQRLFHEFLRHKLRTEAPAIARLSHLRAAGWYDALGDDEGSVRHLIEAGSYHEAFARGVPGVARTFDGRYLRGETNLAVTRLPAGFVEADPFRSYVVAAAHLAGLRPSLAAGRLRAVERESHGGTGRTWLRARAELLRAFGAGLAGDPAAVLHHFERAGPFEAARSFDRAGPFEVAGPTGPAGHFESARAPDRSPPEPGPSEKGPGEEGPGEDGAPQADLAPSLHDLDQVLWRHLAALAALAHVWLGRPDLARSVLQAGSNDGQDALDEADRLSVEARVACFEGRLHEARLGAEEALARGRRRGQTGSILTLDALRTLATVLYERDDLDGSADRLREARHLCEATSLAHWRAALGCDEARVLVARGSPSQALDLLRHLRREQYDDPLPAFLGDRLDRSEIRCRLALGDLGGATRLVESCPPSARAIETMTRLDLAAARPDRAAERLVAAGPAPRVRIAIERGLLLGRAYLQLGDEPRCDAALRRAVDLGRPARFLRIFVDDGAELAGPLRRIAAPSGDPFVAELLAHTVFCSSRSGTAPVGVLEPFTERERELLSYLPSHLSQHEIAGVMYISLNTVKTHTKAVYRKLGATCRSEAVDAARAHGLL